LAPEPGLGLGGIVVTWRQHDRMSADRVHGAKADDLVHDVMNGALAKALRTHGYVVDAFGGGSGRTGRRRLFDQRGLRSPRVTRPVG
jgi:hypothetical protein